MTNGKPEHDEPIEPIPPSKKEVMSSDSAARRHALAVLAKHAAYTAPAVLAILSISVPKAKAGSF